MLNILNFANNTFFTILMAITPVVFAVMLAGTDSIVASIAVAVAYVSVIVGERLDENN